VRIVCVSDTHGVLPMPEIPACDLLLFAGDVEDVRVHPHDTPAQRRHLERVFAPWLAAAPARRKVGIAGNHDFLGIDEPEALRQLPWHYLEDETIEIEGVVVHGSPWTPPFFDWAFMLPEPELAARWELVPAECDVLLTHGPPHRLGDRVGRAYGRDPHQGSTSLRAVVDRHPALRLLVFGHIHEGHGRGVLRRNGLTPLSWVNAARVDADYRPVHEPIVVEL